MATQAPVTVQKKRSIQRVLKAAGRLPRFPVINIRAGLRNGIGIWRNNGLSPSVGETPIVVLRLQVLSCTNLPTKTSTNPFVVVSVLNKKSTTPVSRRTVHPVYAPEDATFDFLIYLSLADRLGIIELVVWDKQTLTKENVGEVSIPLEYWFCDKDKDGRAKEKTYGFDQPGNEPFSLDLISTRANTQSTGSIQVKLGFMPATNTDPQHSMGFEDVYSELLKRTRPSLISAPPTEGVGTIRSHFGLPVAIQYEDDGGLSSDSDDEDENEAVNTPPETRHPPLLDIYLPTSTASDARKPGPKPKSAQRRVTPISPPPMNDLTTPAPIAASEPDDTLTVLTTSSSSPGPSSKVTRFIPKKVLRRFGVQAPPNLDVQSNVQDDLALPSPPAPGPANKDAAYLQAGAFSGVRVGGGLSMSGVGPAFVIAVAALAAAEGGSIVQVGTKRKRDWESKHANDIIGVVVLEVEGADDLPAWPNAIHTGWDMDPFVVVAFSKKVFRTRVIRHSLNPVFDEKLFFHVRRSETGFQVQLTVLDWDKLSANDLVGDATFGVKELIEAAPKPDGETGLYAVDDEGEGVEKGMRVFRLELATVGDLPGDVKPAIKFRAQYHPYDALRQRFWRHCLTQYDTDNTGTLSRLELTAMLDSLGSTLSRRTLSTFFTRFGTKEISIDQAIICLEEELGRPEESRISDVDEAAEASSAEPVVMVVGDHGEEVKLDLDRSFGALQFSGPPHVSLNGAVAHETQPMQMPLEHAAASFGPGGPAEPTNGYGPMNVNDSDGVDDIVNFNSSPRERVVNVHNCPFCHRPRLNSKAAIDVMTHIALCASQDWTRVDRIMLGNFVTASEAERKWYVQVIMDIAAGEYKLGANSANVILQNRTTGQLEEEKMQVYVRLGIRLLYKGFLSKMESESARRLLKALSFKQGMKYDDPESAKEIPTFIKFHRINVDELLDPLDSFKTFNQFFYRKLKPSARPVDAPSDPYRLVSGADCRLLTFETVNQATRLWIKGREFSIARLLGDVYKDDDVETYTGGALAIFRLAPQDYHRFHSPVEGRIGRMADIAGEYYTVNPQAIRTALDVYGENARKVVPIHSPQFGRVMAVCIGAMMVGSIQTTVDEGEYVQRGQEFGYFAFGGSTIVLLFEKGRVNWDEDLLINGRGCLETLVRVGMGIGQGHRVEE